MPLERTLLEQKRQYLGDLALNVGEYVKRIGFGCVDWSGKPLLWVQDPVILIGEYPCVKPWHDKRDYAPQIYGQLDIMPDHVDHHVWSLAMFGDSTEFLVSMGQVADRFNARLQVHRAADEPVEPALWKKYISKIKGIHALRSTLCPYMDR